MSINREEKILPMPLIESTDPIQTAKLYTTQSVLQLATSSPSSSMSPLFDWIENLDIDSIRSCAEKYQTAAVIADNNLPFIRKQVKLAMKKQHTSTNYKMTTCASKKVENLELIEVDGFLYDSLRTGLKSQGLKSDYQCQDCKTTDVIELDADYFSESTSKDALIKLYGVILSETIRDKQILVIKSGIGSLVYGAALFSDSSKIISCESNSKFCDIQRQICKSIDKLRNLVTICNTDMPVECISDSHVVVISNAVWEEWSVVQQIELWKKLKNDMRKDSILVSCENKIQHNVTDGWFIKDDDDDSKRNFYVYKII